MDAFELWCWRRLLRVPWTARRSNQSILKISPEHSLEGLMLKLKLQYFGHLMWSVDSLGKMLMWERVKAGGEGDGRGWQGCMASLAQWTRVWANSGTWWRTGNPAALRALGSQSQIRLSNWTKQQCLEKGLHSWLSGKDPAYQCRRHRRHGFNPWVGKIPCRRNWKPTPVFLPGKSQGQRSLAGYSPWGSQKVRHCWVHTQGLRGYLERKLKRCVSVISCVFRCETSGD